jgi:hypothetical protein
MEIVLTAFVAALAGAIVGPLFAASVEVRQHDQQIRARDNDLEEWLVTRHREFRRRWNELQQQMNAAGILHGGAPTQARSKVGTIALYEYREALRQAHADRAQVVAREGWSHALIRRARRRALPELATPERAGALVGYWSEGTRGNALTWSLADITQELGGPEHQ